LPFAPVRLPAFDIGAPYLARFSGVSAMGPLVTSDVVTVALASLAAIGALEAIGMLMGAIGSAAGADTLGVAAAEAGMSVVLTPDGAAATAEPSLAVVGVDSWVSLDGAGAGADIAACAAANCGAAISMSAAALESRRLRMVILA
jgi:hypothetical protein